MKCVDNELFIHGYEFQFGGRVFDISIRLCDVISFQLNPVTLFAYFDPDALPKCVCLCVCVCVCVCGQTLAEMRASHGKLVFEMQMPTQRIKSYLNCGFHINFDDMCIGVCCFSFLLPSFAFILH